MLEPRPQRYHISDGDDAWGIVITRPAGRRPIQAHGQTEMPIWGDFFMSQTLESPTIDPKDAAMITQGRVLSVVSYLESLQAE